MVRAKGNDPVITLLSSSHKVTVGKKPLNCHDAILLIFISDICKIFCKYAPLAMYKAVTRFLLFCGLLSQREHSGQLRVRLSHPACETELKQLVEAEGERQREQRQAIHNNRQEVQVTDLLLQTFTRCSVFISFFLTH